MQSNLRGYITKCENRLLYQSDKKLEKENPLPDCPDRIKIEKRLARYKATKEKVDYALANLS